jgi:hypothetical protein
MDFREIEAADIPALSYVRARTRENREDGVRWMELFAPNLELKSG